MSHNHCVVCIFWPKGKTVECAVCCAYFLKAKAAWGFNQHHKHVGYYPEIKVGNGQATI